MRINYIKYHNYRCFEDIKVSFETDAKKNIALVMGVTGTGKTEMLFSFQWVLYGFDFNTMREKEETPYPLNSTLYHELENNKHANSVDCWVELSFSEKGQSYTMKRTETFMRKKNVVDSFVKVEFYRYKQNGEKELSLTDKQEVEEMLSRLIPKSILEGITFDGERMKKLNSASDQAKDTIKNVISLITNEQLFSLCATEIKELKDDIRRESNKINKALGNVSATELEKEIKDLEDSIEDSNIEIGIKQKQYNGIDNRLKEISTHLSQLDDARQTEQKRKGLERDLEHAKTAFDKSLDYFYKSLNDGFLLVTDKLVDDVKSSLETIDVPTGLTVEAVKSILKRPRCICGCEMNDDIRRVLTDMLSTLPPDNISSNILYIVNQFKEEKADARNKLKVLYDDMRTSRDSIADIKRKLSEISESLVSNASDQASSLEKERTEKLKLQGVLENDISKCEINIERSEKRLKEAKKELTEAAGTRGHVAELNAQSNLLDLYKNAIAKIGEYNAHISLSKINNYLSAAYSSLSGEPGRCVYICQFDKKDKYRLVTYLEKEYKDRYVLWMNDGTVRTYQDEGLSEEEIKEKTILKILEGKSTGESKVNSLAFAKAIFDYTNEDQTEDSFNQSHDYPFLIDSPFTEISGKTRECVGNNMHRFAKQIILMADDDSYEKVKTAVSPFVKTIHSLVKNEKTGTVNINKVL